MNVEQIEYELSQLNGKGITIVREGFGNQSDSWYGNLTVSDENIPVKFHFTSINLAILFTADDVLSVEPPARPPLHPIVRLKGPRAYLHELQTA